MKTMDFFKLKENGTSVSTEVTAGLTTFFAMAYIIAVNPSILGQTGMPWGAVFLATIIASIVGTLIMGLFANVPYGLAPGMGLNAFFTFTVVKGVGFTWQEAMSMVFICGIINIIITATSLRKMIIKSIPPMLQHAIGGGIGIFIAYVGWLNKGAFVIAIAVAALIGIPYGLTSMGKSISIVQSFQQLPETAFAIFTPKGFPALFADPARLPLVLVTIFAFSLSDTFDTIGTFIGTGRRAGIFSADDEKQMEEHAGFSSKMDKALFADATATSIGSLLGTSNTTTYVESAAGIAAGGRTGLTSVIVAAGFALSTVFAPLISAIPSAATSPVLVIVGCMMMSSFAEIAWDDLTIAIPAFFTGVFMAFAYSISYGIAAGFITYCIVKVCKKEAKQVHPIIWGVALLFIIDLTLQAII